MFSQESRCHLANNQLAEVICQLRFPEILMIDSTPPAEFQEAIRSQFPLYHAGKEVQPPKLTGTPGNLKLEPRPEKTSYSFTTTDGIWRLNLSSNFISLTCNQYPGWEDFSGMLDRCLAAFILIYKPAHFSRVGLRYMNFISRKSLSLEGVPFRELIAPCYLGPLGEEDMQESTVARSTVDAEFSVLGDAKVKLHAGPGLVKMGGRQDPEVKFILDFDLFMPGNVPVNHAAGALQTLHYQAYPLFRGAITDMLFDAMK